MEFWGQVSGQLVIFEGSLADMLRFWSSQLHFWRKCRTKASFLSFKASFLKDVSQKSFAFELQSFIFEGSLAEMLRFWASKNLFWKKSRTTASFLSFKAIFEGSLADMLRFWASKLHFWRKSRRNALFLSFKLSILREVSQTSFESQIDWQPNHLNLRSIDNQLTWNSNQLTTNSLKSQTDWQPNHLKLKSIDNQLT